MLKKILFSPVTHFNLMLVVGLVFVQSLLVLFTIDSSDSNDSMEHDAYNNPGFESS